MPVNQLSRTERLCAITDGVYAIVLTLLILDLKTPEIPGIADEKLIVDLAKQSRNFISYIISFLVIAWFWFRHHEIFKALERCNNFLIGLNFFHMLLLSLIPYTASLAGRYEKDQLAVLLFLINLFLCGLSIAILSQYVVNKTEWHGTESAEQLLKQHWLYRYSFIVVAIPAIIVSFFNHNIALYVCFLFPVVIRLVTRSK
jgi:uncharacterized membrane protein